MRDLQSKLGTHQLRARLRTIKDKKRLISTPQPGMIIVELAAKAPNFNVIIREWVFEDNKANQLAARALYDNLKYALA